MRRLFVHNAGFFEGPLSLHRMYAESNSHVVLINLCPNLGANAMTTRQVMHTLLQKLDADVRYAQAGGGSAAIERHRARDKLLPRERISGILDAGSPFLELSPLAGQDLYGESLHRGLLSA